MAARVNMKSRKIMPKAAILKMTSMRTLANSSKSEHGDMKTLARQQKRA
jgi:hypothetical protein